MQVSPARYRQVTVGALVAVSAIIVSGGAVRLTNSGLGCDDWPNCNSQSFIDVSSTHSAIEQINRMFTFAVGAAVIAAVLGALWRVPRRSDLIYLSAWVVLGVVANAVLGGISVLVDLHPMAVQGHMLLSMMLVVAATTLVRRASEPDGVPRVRVVSRPTEQLAWLIFAITSVAIVAGTVVTGAGPHAGDETAERLDIAIPTAARMHAVSVLAAIALSLLLAWRLRSVRADRRIMQPALARWIGVALAQAALGYIQYFSDVPALLVGLHMLGATLVMIATTFLALDARQAVAAAGPLPGSDHPDGISTRPASV